MDKSIGNQILSGTFFASTKTKYQARKAGGKDKRSDISGPSFSKEGDRGGYSPSGGEGS